MVLSKKLGLSWKSSGCLCSENHAVLSAAILAKLTALMDVVALPLSGGEAIQQIMYCCAYSVDLTCLD